MADFDTAPVNTSDTAEQPQFDPAMASSVQESLLPPVNRGGDSSTLFTDVNAAATAAGQPSGPFTSIHQDGTSDSNVNRYGPDQTNTTAALGALAAARLKLTDGTDNFSNIIQANQAVINAGQEKDMRLKLAQAQRTNEVNDNLKLQSDVLTGDQAFAGTTLKDIMNLGLAKQASPLDPNTLEAAGVAHLQTMAAQDPDQAAIMQNLLGQGDVLDRVRDNVTKLVMFNREMDALKQQKANEGWASSALDFAGGFVPFKDYFARTGNAAGSTFWSLPSTKQNAEVQTFWNQSVADFGKNLPGVFDNFKVTNLGATQNLTKALEVAQQFGAGGLNNSDALSFNLWTAADVAGVLPLERMAMVPSKMARLLGNRVAAADISAATLANEIHGIDSGLAGVQSNVHALEESLPSSVVPDTATLVRPDVGVPSDIADRLKAIKDSAQAAQDAIVRQERLSPEQLNDAVQKAVERAQTQFRDDGTIDYKSEVIPTGTAALPQEVLDRDLNGPKANGLVVARKMPDGSIKYGQPGDVHFNLMTDSELNADISDKQIPNQMGFAEPGGKFLTREEAAAQVGQAGRLESVRSQGPVAASFGRKGQELSTTAEELTNPEPYDNSARMMFDPDADLDSLSYQNARGEVYSNEPIRSTSSIGAPDAAEVAQKAADAAEFAARPEEVGGIRSIPTVSKDLNSGVYSLNFYLGKRYSSGGFITKAGAEAAATRRGFALDQIGIHQNSDAQWFIKVKQAVREDGITNPVLRAADLPDLGLFPRISTAIKSADNIMPEIFNNARITQTVGKSQFMAKVVKPWVHEISKLNKKSARVLSKVMMVGEREQKWFNINEFEQNFERAAGRLPSKQETIAYYAAKELSDINYHIFNSNIYAEKASRGVVTVSARNDAVGFNTGRMNGRVIENPDFNSLRVYDLDNGVTHPAGSNTDALQDRFDRGNSRVIELERAYERPGEDPVKHVFASNDSSTVGALERDQLGYVAGGSRENRSKWFVKQAVSGQLKDGTTYWQNPITHIAAKTRLQADQWAVRMENARKAFFNTSLSDIEKRRIIELSSVETPEKFAQLVEDGVIQRDHPFETLFDKENPRAMSHIGERDSNWITAGESSDETYAISKGRMYYSSKGDRLLDPNGEYAEILDPFTTLSKATQNAAQTFAFGDYNKRVVDEWSRMAAPYIDRNSIGNNHDSFNLFFNGKISQDVYRSNPSFANQLDAIRNTHKRLMGMRTAEQSMTYTAARRFASWVETKGKWGETLAGAAIDRMSANPVNAVRGMVFDAKLGFFDPSQLIVQTQTALAAMTANPIYGARTAAMLAPLSHLLINQSENLLDYYAKNLAAIHGLDPADFKDMVRSLRNSGWMQVGGEVAQLDQYINTIGGSAFSRGFNKFRELGRIPFNMSEKFNRLTAYSMAWKTIRDANPAMKAGDVAFQNLVNKSADNLSMNMTSSSGAMWQKGVLSVPTQFLAYQTRVLENILPKMFGGSAQFSAGQKLRLALGQTLLYGSAGLPLGDELMAWVSKQYSDNNNGQQLSPELWRVMTKGFWDSAMYYGTDGKLDTDFASRAGQGPAWTDFWNKLTDGSMNNVLQVATGPSGAFVGNMVDVVGKISKYMQAEQFGNLSADDWTLMAGDITQQISSLNRLQKAYWLMKTGQLVDPKTGEAIVNADRINSIAAALGIPLRQETERWDIIRDNKERNDEIRQMGQMISSIRRNAFTAMGDGDIKKEQYYNKMAAGLLSAYHDDPMMMTAIANETNKQLGYSSADWDALVTKLYSQTGQRPNGGQ